METLMKPNRWVELLCREMSRLCGTECRPRLMMSAGIESKLQDVCQLPIDPGTDSTSISEACLRYAATLQALVCLPSNGGHYAFAFPISSDDLLPWYVFGNLEADSEREAKRLLEVAHCAAVSAIGLERQKQGAIAASQHMSRVMQEQSWLRDLASMTRIEHSSVGLEKLVSTILEPMQRILQAEGVALCVQGCDASDPRYPVSKIVTIRNWTLESMTAILRDFPLPELGQVRHFDNVQLEMVDGMLEGLVIGAVPIRGKSRAYLIALNHYRVDANHRITGTVFEQHEVGLLYEVVNHLTTYYANLQYLIEGEQFVLDTLRAMSQTIEVRDPYTRGHSDRVARLAGDLAENIGLSSVECQHIVLSGILHDIGKIGVPDNVLLKPGRLTQEETAIIQHHPEIGCRILKSLAKLSFTLPGVLHHHERWDGKGYPHGLKGEEIPLMARILAVADAFDAMSTSRPYRVAMPLEKTVEVLRDGAGTYWDPDLIPPFLKQISEERRPKKQASLGLPMLDGFQGISSVGVPVQL